MNIESKMFDKASNGRIIVDRKSIKITNIESFSP